MTSSPTTTGSREATGDRALVVTSDDPDRRPLGLLTDGDIFQAVADGRDPEKTGIWHVWSSTPASVEPGTLVTDAVRTMLADKIHRLLVVDAGRLVGIVDLSDLCRVRFVDDASARI